MVVVDNSVEKVVETQGSDARDERMGSLPRLERLP